MCVVGEGGHIQLSSPFKSVTRWSKLQPLQHNHTGVEALLGPALCKASHFFLEFSIKFASEDPDAT